MRSSKISIASLLLGLGSIPAFFDPEETAGPVRILNNQYKNKSSGRNRLSKKKRRIRARQMASVK